MFVSKVVVTFAVPRIVSIPSDDCVALSFNQSDCVIDIIALSMKSLCFKVMLGSSEDELQFLRAVEV